MPSETFEPKKPGGCYTIKSLQLDLKAARAGRTWAMLPPAFRNQEDGGTYPLPTRRQELQILTTIYTPPNKKDAGCVYLRRAMAAFKKAQARTSSQILDLSHRRNAIETRQKDLILTMKQKTEEVKEATEKAKEFIQKQAEEAVASMSDLFSLSRKGLDGQMQAHLAGEEWKKETITAHAFRECVRIVTQTVKGLGLPSEERTRSTEAINKEIADSLEGTRDALDLAPGSDDGETKH